MCDYRKGASVGSAAQAGLPDAYLYEQKRPSNVSSGYPGNRQRSVDFARVNSCDDDDVERRPSIGSAMFESKRSSLSSSPVDGKPRNSFRSQAKRFGRQLKKSFICQEDFRSYSYWSSIVAEFTGTFLLMFLGFGGIVINFSHPTYANGEMDANAVIKSAVCFGAVVGGIVFWLGHVSAHINPAMTLACLLLGKITVVRALSFVVVQLAGSTMGFALCYATIPFVRKDNFACTFVDSSISPIEGAELETAMTTVLVMAGLTTVTKFEKAGHDAALSAMGIFGIITLLLCIGVSFV